VRKEVVVLVSAATVILNTDVAVGEEDIVEELQA
jgi:hypothetical protein